MKKPNDLKRPNTHSGHDDRARKLNQKYFWVSKPILEIKDNKTGLVHRIAQPKGKTYKKLDHAFKKNKNNERTQDSQRDTQGS